MFEHVSWIGVAIAAAFTFVLGALWYGPLFGKRWIVLIGKRMEDLGTASPPIASLLLSAITALVSATGISVLVGAFANDLVTAAFVGLLVWAVAVLPVKLNDVSYAGRPLGLFYVDGAYQFVSLVGMAVITGAMRV